MHRRTFLKSSAAGALAMASASWPVGARSRDRLQVAMIGTGLRGQSQLGPLLSRSDVDLVAICDTQQMMLDKTLSIIEQAGRRKPRVYGGNGDANAWKALLASKGIDAAVSYTHLDVYKRQNQWSVLETLTPSEYMEFREVLGPSSGFQSLQYRTVEFLLGNKNAGMVKVFKHDDAAYASLTAVLDAPSLYDEFLRYLARWGHAIPAAHLERDWSRPHVLDEALLPVFERIYEDPNRYWREYALCEDMVCLLYTSRCV